MKTGYHDLANFLEDFQNYSDYGRSLSPLSSVRVFSEIFSLSDLNSASNLHGARNSNETDSNAAANLGISLYREEDKYYALYLQEQALLTRDQYDQFYLQEELYEREYTIALESTAESISPVLWTNCFRRHIFISFISFV